MAAPQSIVDVQSIYYYRKGVWENAVSKNLILNMLMKKGGFIQKVSGTRVEWVVNAGLPTAYAAGDYALLDSKLIPHNYDARAYLGWSMIVVPEAVSGYQLAQNQGEQALIRDQDVKIARMFKAATTEGKGSVTGHIFYGDGTKDGSGGVVPYVDDGAVSMYGLKAIFPTPGTSVTTGKEACYTTTATYAGHTLNAPMSGVDNADSTAWHSHQVNLNYGWGGASCSASWTPAMPEVLDYAIANAIYSDSDETMQPDSLVMCKNHWLELLAYMEDKQRVNISPGFDPKTVGSIGFNINSGMVGHGVQAGWCANCPDGYDYLLNTDQMWMWYLKRPEGLIHNLWPGKKSADRFGMDGDWLDLFVQPAINRAGGGFNLVLEVKGQLGFNPKFQTEFKAY